MGEQNYFLFIVNTNHQDGLFVAGDYGVGTTSLGPGIEDCLYGTMYVIPGESIKRHKPGAETIKSRILNYYFAR